MTELKGKLSVSALKKGVAIFLAACLCATMVQTDIFAAAGTGQRAASPGQQTVEVSGIKLNKTKATIKKGASLTLTATVSPSNAANKSVTWTSSNTKVATVKNGKVSAKAVGTATITAKTVNGKTATCKITVSKPDASKVTLNKKSATVLKGKTVTLKATVSPSDAANKSVTWSTSNKKVATVKNGKVTAKGPGTATITAKTKNGKKATCKITVPGVTLKKTSATVKVGKTCKIQVKSTVVKKDKVVSYKVKDKKVAKVSKKGVVTGLKKGKTTVTVKMKSGATATFKVTVKK